MRSLGSLRTLLIYLISMEVMVVYDMF